MTTDEASKSDRTQIMPFEYHCVFYKEDYQNLNYSDDESHILVKPLVTAEIEKEPEKNKQIRDYSVKSFYRF